MARTPKQNAGTAPTAPPSTGPKDKDEREPAPAASAPPPPPPPETPKPAEQTEPTPAAEKPPKATKPAAAPAPAPAAAPAPAEVPAAPMPKRSTRVASKGQAVATYGTSKTPRHFGQVQACMTKPGGLIVIVKLDGSTADDADIQLPLYPSMDEEQRQQLRDGGVTAWAEWPDKAK